jgi:phenylacetate-CoA ligase
VSIERWLFGSLIYPAYHVLQRDDVLGKISEYARTERFSAADVAAVQAQKLAGLMEHAARHVPYYRQVLGNRAPDGFSADDLRRLPPLTKQVVRDEARNLVAENADRGDLESNSTSGSTGEPLYFYTDKRSSDCRKATAVRNRHWAGIKPGDREMRLWGSPIDNAQARALRGIVHSWLTRTRMLSAYDLSDANLRRYFDEMRRFRPRLLVSYPSVLEELVRAAQRLHVEVHRPQAIIVSAETLYPYQRDLFAETFGVQVFNRYGSREVGDIAQECAKHRGLHLNADRILVEIVRDDLTPCAAGETGDVLVTDLDNYGMPLIRYAIGDRATVGSGQPCPCGLGLPLLEGVEGRSLDVVRFPNGSGVGGTYWTILLRAHAGIRQFQVVQEDLEHVTIKYIADAPLSQDLRDFVERDVAQRAGPDLVLSFEKVNDIPLSAGGKRRLVVVRQRNSGR